MTGSFAACLATARREGRERAEEDALLCLVVPERTAFRLDNGPHLFDQRFGVTAGSKRFSTAFRPFSRLRACHVILRALPPPQSPPSTPPTPTPTPTPPTTTPPPHPPPPNHRSRVPGGGKRSATVSLT